MVQRPRLIHRHIHSAAVIWGQRRAHGRVWRGIKRMQFSGERWTRQIWQVRYSSYEIAHHGSFCRWQQDATLVDKQLIAKQPRLANSGNWHEILQPDHESCSSLSNYHQKYLVQRSSCSPSSYYAWRYAWALIPASWSFSLYLCMGAKGCLLVLAYTFVASLAACLCLGCAAGVTRQLFSLYRLLWGHSVQCLMQSTLDIDRTKVVCWEMNPGSIQKQDLSYKEDPCSCT